MDKQLGRACSGSQTSSTGHTSQDHSEDSARNFRSETSTADTAARAQRKTAQIAALLSTQAGQAIVMRHLSQATEDPRASAKCQTDQLAAMLSTEAGNAALQKQLNDYLWRTQQIQGPLTSAQSLAPGSTDLMAAAPTCAAAAAGPRINKASSLAKTIADTAHAADPYPGVPSATVAVSHSQPSTADHAASLAVLKHELVQHAASHITPALAGANRTAEALLAAAALNKKVAPQEQQLQQPCNTKNALATWLVSQSAAAGENMPAAVGGFLSGQMTPTSSSLAANAAQPVATILAMLQQHQQRQQQQKVDAGQDLMRCDTLMSDAQQESAVAVGLTSSTVTRVPGQVVFKRRATNSTALRRHFGNANKTATKVTPAKSTDSTTSGVSKPNQVFKKQRKKPLMLWSSSSTLPQQVQAAKLQHQQQTSSQYNKAEAEYSCVTGGSGAATSLSNDAAGSLLRSLAAASAPVAASRAEHVLSTLARQEQQLIILQQQIKQQRELITARRQAQAQQQQQAAAAVPLSASVVQQLLLRGLQAGSMQLAAADVDMTEALQTTADAPPDAGSSLLNLAKLVAAQQQQQQQVSAASAVTKAASVSMASQGPVWDADVLRRLTAALLAV